MATRVRPMLHSDLDACMALKAAAGWNQLEADWLTFLELYPQGCFVAAAADRLVGTVTAIAYQDRFGWIGMMLVDPDVRRRGIATALMQAAMESLDGCETVRLDATPVGRHVYERLGFVAEYPLRRMVRDVAVTGAGVSVPALDLEVRPRPLRPTDLDRVTAFDTPIFGADRGPVLARWFSRAPHLAWMVEYRGACRGYCLGRPGANYDCIGPIVAVDEDTAGALLSRATAQSGARPLCLDMPEHTPSFLQTCEQLGFALQRPFTRMFRGPNSHPGKPALTWALCGPEVG